MGMAPVPESEIQARILKTLGGRSDIRLFRNHVGSVQDRTGRWHSFGLAKGSADLIGWQTVEVTPDMVGQKIAVFLSIEVKTTTGKTKPEQEAWARTVASKGGKAGIARSVEDAQNLCSTNSTTNSSLNSNPFAGNGSRADANAATNSK